MQLINTIIGIIPYVGIAWGLATLLPGISVTVRRLHDTSRSGFWYLGIFGGLIAGIILTAVGGAAKEAALIALGLIAILACGITSIVLMCLPSTPCKNKYGELRK